MTHQGHKLKDLAKSKGFNMSELAKEFGVTRAAIEKHFRSERLTRKVVKPYADKFGFSLDDFFEDVDSGEIVRKKRPDYEHTAASINYRDELIESLEETIKEQRKHIETLTTMVRFFPSAVYQTSLTA